MSDFLRVNLLMNVLKRLSSVCGAMFIALSGAFKIRMLFLIVHVGSKVAHVIEKMNEAG